MTDEKENKPTGVEVEGQGDPALDPNTGPAANSGDVEQLPEGRAPLADDIRIVDEDQRDAAENEERRIYEKCGRAPLRLEAMEQALIRSGKLHPNYFVG